MQDSPSPVSHDLEYSSTFNRTIQLPTLREPRRFQSSSHQANSAPKTKLAAKNATSQELADQFFTMRTKTETATATVTRFAIDPPMATQPSIHIGSFNDAIQHVGAPAFGSTIMFLTTAIAVFLSTAAVTYLLLQSKGPLMKVYSGQKASTAQQSPEQDKKVAMEYARMVTLCHVLVIFVLVVRTREGLVTLAPVAYEVCALILGIEAAVCVVAGAIWGVVKMVEYGEAGAKAKGA